jgi:hypothetical protein
MNRLQSSKDLGNGVRPLTALGLNGPIWRLDALVSLPDSTEKIMMVVKTPDRSLSLQANELHATAGKTFPLRLCPGAIRNGPQPRGEGQRLSRTLETRE